MFFSLLKCFGFTCCLLIAFLPSSGQVTVTGTVYDITKRTTIEAVSVISTGGNGTITNSMGKYSISLSENDSIYFSYLNKSTPRYPVTGIANLTAFDISILIKISVLPTVFVKPRNYRLDSLKNREDYASIFNYNKPGFSTSLNNTPGSVSAGLDLAAFIGMFNFKKIRRTISFQNRLLSEEQDKYISHRYNKKIVKQLTQLNSPELEVFMARYKPGYEVVLSLNELELGQYILDSFKNYKVVID